MANLVDVPDLIQSLDENNLDNNRPLKCSYCGNGRHTFNDCLKRGEQRHITGSEYCPSCLKKSKEELHWSHNCKAMRSTAARKQLVESGIAAGRVQPDVKWDH